MGSLREIRDSVSSLLRAQGAVMADLDILLPAAPFLDMAGEDLRRRVFLTESETGESLCLRPEFTIPVCLKHIESGAHAPQRYGYCGEVFRQMRHAGAEFLQAGIEDLGDPDIALADARIIGDAMTLLHHLMPAARLDIVVGDQAVFAAVVEALGLPEGWQRRLARAFGQPDRLKSLLDSLARSSAEQRMDGGVAALLLGASERDLVHQVEAAMQATGYSAHAGRSAEDIARRLKQKADLARVRLEPEQLHVLESFLALAVPLEEAPAALSRFADDARLAIHPAITHFKARLAALGRNGQARGDLVYRASFGRPLDYYTALVFEISTSTEDARTVLAGGGRYDRLLPLLGSPRPVPAVGFSLWLDRIMPLVSDPVAGGMK